MGFTLLQYSCRFFYNIRLYFGKRSLDLNDKKCYTFIMTINSEYIRKLTGFKVYAVKRCNATFDDIGENDAIIALSQNHGAGRGDHTFYSPPGGLYIVMRERGLSIDPHTLTPAVGLAVHDTVKSVLGVETRLKWVNDVMLGNKKICGILCRSPRRAEYLIGMGINYATDIAALMKAGLTEAGTLNAPEKLATEFCAQLIRNVHLAALSPFDYVRYNDLCDTVGKMISFTQNGITVQGFAEGIETDGTLIVRIGKATVAVDAGEVSIVREIPPQALANM